MEKIKILALNKEKILILIQFATLIGVATVAPLFKQQIVTGTIVNATLFIATMVLGVRGAFLVGLIPSITALSIGLLPPVLAPMIPFIMVGNTILIIIFSYFEGKNYWVGVILASILKFVFLFGTSSIVINLLLKKEIASQVAMMMSWPQLLTALLGGLLAWVFFRKNHLPR